MEIKNLQKAPFFLDDNDVKWVQSTWESLSLEEKAGQMFLPLCRDLMKDSSEAYLDSLLKFKPGGIHRFSTLPAPVLRDSARYLQENSRIPLFMTSDLEFGTLGAIGDGGTPYQTQLGAAASPHGSREAERMARIAAREGRLMGFNWSFTPVVDINYNFRSYISSTRSFGSNPDHVKDLGAAYVRAMQEEGVAATAKHWPGDGLDERDQHMVTTHNTMTMEEWHATYGMVYREMIKNHVLSVMSAHITLGAYDRQINPHAGGADILPGTINRNLNIKLLREELGFNGVIVSDATGMAGLSSQGPREQIVPQVINSGCDIFLFSVDNDLDYGFLLKAVKEGTIPAERVEEAVLRILALKASLGLHKKQKTGRLVPSQEEVDKYLGCEEHKRWSRECFSSTITLVKDTQKLLPINPDTHKRVLLIQNEPMGIMGPSKPLVFGNLLRDKGFDVTEMSEGLFPSPGRFDLVIYLLNQVRFFGQGSYFANWPELHKGTMKGMIRTWDMIPTLMISLSNPYHLFDAPRVKTCINAYTGTDQAQEEVLRLIMGEGDFQGVNPVDPFCGLEDSRL